MAIAYVAGASNSGGSGTSYTTAGVDTTGATLLIVVVVGYSVNAPVTVTDSVEGRADKSNTWTALTASTSISYGQVKIYWCNPSTVGSGHTATVSDDSAIYGGLSFLAFSGTDTSSPFDVENGNTVAGSSTISTGSVTPAGNGSLIIYGAATGAGSGTVNLTSVDVGTLQHNWAYTNGTRYGFGAAYYVQATAAAINPVFTISVNSNNAARIAVFKAAAGGGNASASGSTLRAAARFTAGGATATRNASTSGATLRAAARFTGGAATAVRNASAAGATLRAAARFRAGGASVPGTGFYANRFIGLTMGLRV